MTGDATYWLGLLAGLAQLDTEFEFLLLSNNPQPPRIPHSENFHWRIVSGSNDRLWSLLKLPHAARSVGADLVHTQYFASPLFSCPTITTIHDVSFFVGPEWFKPKDRMLLRKLVPGSVRRAARVLTVSQSSQNDIEKFIPAALGKTRFAYLAPHPGLSPLEPEVARQVVRQLFKLDQPYLLTVGTRWPRKNMELAVRASDLLPQDLPHRLAITGKSGWGDNELGARGVALGYVTESGLSALYGAADLLLVPSRYEGFGLPVVEAFACGCPVFCSAGGSLPEICDEAGYVERSWEPEAWSHSISSLLRDSSKLEAMRNLGAQRAQQFSWKKMAMQTLEVYREALSC